MKVVRTPKPSRAANWEKPHDEEWDKRFRKAMLMAKSSPLNLSSDERHDLAKMVPGVDSNGDGSWKSLTTGQLDSLLNMLEGWVFITYLLQEREQS